MIVSFQKDGKSVSIKIFVFTYIGLLVVAVVLGYLGYSTIMKFQTDQNTLQSKYDDLRSKYSTLKTDYSELQKNNSLIQSKLADLQSQFDTLHSQQSMIQSKYSTLQANYTTFMVEYQKLRPINPFSYLIFTDGNEEYFAVNGTTRIIDHSGTDLASVLNMLITPGRTLCFLPGIYYLNSPVNVFAQNGTSISGAGVDATIIEVTYDVCAFNITGNNSKSHNSGFSMSNIAINSTALSTQPAIFIKYMNDVKLEDVTVSRFRVGYDIESTEKVYIHRCKVFSDASTFKTGFRFVGYSIDIFLTDTIVLHNQPSGIGYSFDNCDSITLTNAVANPTLNSYGNGGYGFLFSTCHWVNLVGTISDGNGDHGYYMSSGFRFQFTGAWAGSNYGNGLQSDSAGQIILSSCSFYTNRLDGIKLNNSDGTTISTTISKGNTLYGLEVSNTTGITVTSSILMENGCKGIFFDVGNSHAIIQNNVCLDNSDTYFDIYISTPNSSSFSVVNDNFGRIYHSK